MLARVDNRVPGFSADNRVQLSEGLSVAVPRNPVRPELRERDPVQLHHYQQMKTHWIHDFDPADAIPFDGVDEAPLDSKSFGRQLEETRRRSKRLHTDPMDLDGPGKFHEMRKAVEYTRELDMDDPMGGFRTGDTAALKPEGNEEEYFRNRADFDFCVVVGKAWERGFIEVKFHSDNQVATVKPQHLVKIDRPDIMARKLRFRTSAWNLSSEAGQGAQRPGLRSASLPAIEAGTRRTELGPGRRGARAAGRQRAG